MAADPGVRLTFRVLLVPIGPDGAERRDDAIDAGTTEITLRLETGRPGPVVRDAGLDEYVKRTIRERSAGIGPEIPDTQANDQRPRGQVTDPDYVPGYGTPADRRRRGEFLPETGEEYAARLEREDLTPHVSPGLPGTIPTPRDVPHRARRASFPNTRVDVDETLR